MKPRAPAAITACVVALACSVACAAACGGRVDGGTGSSSTSGGFGGASSTPGERPPGTGTGRPKRPPPAPLSNAAVASMIAEDYCKAFSACCVGKAQPPIDVARCRVLTSAAVEQELDVAGATETSLHDATVCTAAIHVRVATCSDDDNRWPGKDLPIFAPPTIATACQALLSKVTVPSFERCSAAMPCQAPEICAIDVCSTSQLLGTGCGAAPCFDGGECIGGECMPTAALGAAGASCATEIDCRVGLVCFEQKCAPTRDHPELAKQRSSPYRIGADTCSAYDYL